MNILDSNTLRELSGIISSLEELRMKAADIPYSANVNEVINVTARQINSTLYMSTELCISGGDNESLSSNEQEDINSVVTLMLPIWKRSIERRSGNNTDKIFWTIYEYFKYVDRDIIIKNALDKFNQYPEEYRKLLAPKKNKETSSLIRLEKKSVGDISLKRQKPLIFSAIA